jgi:broad specificity phosphatase PhoE
MLHGTNGTALAEPDFAERGVDTSEFVGPAGMPQKPVPKPKEQAQTKLEVDESVQGLPGTANLAGFVQDIGEYDSKLIGLGAIRIYQKMRRNDPTVAALELARTLPIRAADWDIVPGIDQTQPGYALAKEIADMARENFFGGLERTTAAGEKRTQTFESVIENALLSVLGCAAHEDIWEVDKDKGRVRLARLAPRLPDTFYQFVTEPDGETLYELIQFGYRGPAIELLPIKASKLAYFVLNREGANFYGRSIFRPCYTPWYFKQHLMKIEAVAVERNGLGIPTIELGPNASDDDKRAAWDYASKLSTNERSAMVLPNGFTFALTGIKGRVLSAREAIQYYDQQILIAGLSSWLLLGQTSTGTRAVGSVQKDFFLLAEEAFAQMVADTITTTSLRRLVDFNYRAKPGEVLPYPKLVCSDIRMVELETVLNAVRELAAQDVDMLRPTPERDDAVAEMLGLPKLSKGERGPRLAPIVTRQNLANEVVEGTGEHISPATPKGGEKRTDVVVKETSSDGSKRKEDVKLSEGGPHPTVYFIRHAHTALNKDTDPADEKLKGQTDVPPDAEGLEQARRDAEQFRGKKVDDIFTSPLSRARALADAIATVTGAAVHDDPDLLPWDYHKLVGMTRKAAEPLLDEARAHPDSDLVGEPYADYLERWKRGVQHAISHAKAEGRSVAVVTHSPNLKDLDYALGRGPAGADEAPETGGVVSVRLDDRVPADPTIGHWVTINGNHVFIDESGSVLKGPRELVGKRFGDEPIVRGTADAVADRLRGMGYDTRVQHSGSAYGPSSYVYFRRADQKGVEYYARISTHDHNPRGIENGEVGSYHPYHNTAEEIANDAHATASRYEDAKARARTRAEAESIRRSRLTPEERAREDRMGRQRQYIQTIKNPSKRAAAIRDFEARWGEKFAEGGQTHRDAASTCVSCVSQQPERVAAGHVPEDKAARIDDTVFLADVKRPRTLQSPFWREGHDPSLRLVHPHEMHVDFPAHQAKMDAAELKVKHILLRARRKLLRDAAARGADILQRGASVTSLTVAPPIEVKPEIEPLLAAIYQYAREEFRNEHNRLAASAPVALAEDSRPASDRPDPSPLLAEIALDRYAGEIANGVRRVVNNIRTGAVTIADLPRNPDGSYDLTGLSKNELADLIWEEAQQQQSGIPAISPNLEDNIAAGAVRDAFRRGRSQEAQQIIEALERAGAKVQIIRVAMLDKNVCGPCEAADGKPWPLDVPVSVICEGGDLCRCEPVEVRD